MKRLLRGEVQRIEAMYDEQLNCTAQINVSVAVYEGLTYIGAISLTSHDPREYTVGDRVEVTVAVLQQPTATA